MSDYQNIESVQEINNETEEVSVAMLDEVFSHSDDQTSATSDATSAGANTPDLELIDSGIDSIKPSEWRVHDPLALPGMNLDNNDNINPAANPYTDDPNTGLRTYHYEGELEDSGALNWNDTDFNMDVTVDPSDNSLQGVDIKYDDPITLNFAASESVAARRMAGVTEVSLDVKQDGGYHVSGKKESSLRTPMLNPYEADFTAQGTQVVDEKYGN